nr:immunoglobulin heavy chain junction region [Macaca mulatta]
CTSTTVPGTSLDVW